MKKILLLLVLMLCIQYLRAQNSDERTFAPLFILTNGMGRILPFHNGEMLEVGRKYDMVAVPDRGYEFSGWQEVNIFSDIEYTMSPSGQLVERESDIVVPLPVSSKDPILHFTMEDTYQTLFDVPDIRILAQTEYWQADFVPRPAKQKAICKKF